MPTPVDKYYEQVKEENPSYSESQAWATAWKIYCQHVNPDSKSCHQPKKSFLRDAPIVLRVIARFQKTKG